MEKRIENHPILGESPKGKLVKFSYDGTTLEGYEGEPIAAALRVAGVMAHRYTREFDTLKSKKVLQSLETGLFFCQIFIFSI